MADFEIVKVAANLKSTRLFDPAEVDLLEAGRSDQPSSSWTAWSSSTTGTRGGRI